MLFAIKIVTLIGILTHVTIKSSSCSWWNIEACEEGEIALGLAFLHMRKAGGTHMLAVIETWLRRMGCMPKEKSMGTGGIAGGKTENWDKHNDGSPPEVTCPHIDVVHSEFECLNENSLKYMPAFGNARKSHNISFFTSLRHPISRIISQAFYSGVAYEVISQQVVTGCDKYFPNITRSQYNSIFYHHSKCNAYGKANVNTGKIVTMPKREEGMCTCVADNHRVGLEILKSDEDIWFNWMEKSVGFSDHYMDNYYIKRLFVSKDIITLPHRNCWIFPCTENVTGFRKMKAFIETPFRLCNFGDYNTDKGYSEAKALQHVKQLLRDKFDIIILELIHERQTMKAMESIFHQDISSISETIFRHDRRGVHQNTSNFDQDSTEQLAMETIGADIMPKSVQKAMYARNALDIELYHFAVDLFHQKYS